MGNGKITKELKGLGTKINDKEPNGETISEVIKGISDDYEGGGSGATYTAGNGIAIDEQNVISNTAILHAYFVIISGTFGGSSIDFRMLVYSNNELTTEMVRENPTLLNVYKGTCGYDDNDGSKTNFFIYAGKNRNDTIVELRQTTSGAVDATNPTITVEKNF